VTLAAIVYIAMEVTLVSMATNTHGWSMVHSNLSDSQIGLFIRDLSVRTTVFVHTQDSRYILNCLDGEVVTVMGNGKYFNYDEPAPAILHGSTWGGSMIKPGWLGVGMHMEICEIKHRRITTSKITKLQIIKSEPRFIWTDLIIGLVLIAASSFGVYCLMRE